MSLHIYENLEQGTDDWLEARRGIITASVIGTLIAERWPSAIEFKCAECRAEPNSPCQSKTRKPDEPSAPIKTLHGARAALAAAHRERELPNLEPSTSDAARSLTAKLVAERITGDIEPTFMTEDMSRGHEVEIIARDLYSRTHAPVEQVGFMVRDIDGLRLGYSPDGLVDEQGLIEVKGPRAKAHLLTHLSGEVPPQHMPQIQCGLFVSGRQWCDFISYWGGMPPFVKRVERDERWMRVISEVVVQFETTAAEMQAKYDANTEGLPSTERLPDHHTIDLTGF